jgi:hypothetical protein
VTKQQKEGFFLFSQEQGKINFYDLIMYQGRSFSQSSGETARGAMVESEPYLYSSNAYISRTLTSGQEYYIRVRQYYSYSGTYRIVFNSSMTAPSGS